MICLNPKSKIMSDGSELAYRCGKCINCRILKRQQWTLRLIHEKAKWDHLYFFTLTYDDDNLPENNSLNRLDCRKFLKKLWRRDYVFKYFLVGEYGSTYLRPHYHLLLFTNLKLEAQYRFSIEGKKFLYFLDTLKFKKLWSLGNVFIEEVYDVGGINYLTSYVEKKIITKLAKDRYYEDGRASEFQMQSKGLGNPSSENALSDYLTLGSCKIAVPKYYKDKNRSLVEKKKLFDFKKLDGFLNFSSEAYLNALKKYHTRNDPRFLVDDDYRKKVKLQLKNCRDKHIKGVL